MTRHKVDCPVSDPDCTSSADECHDACEPPVKDWPLLFSAPMVRALLAGRKTQTRRLYYQRSRRPHPIAQARARNDWVWGRETTMAVGKRVAYRADSAVTIAAGQRWTPSIHMPKARTRLWLPLGGVRVERLQAITDADARAEGIFRLVGCGTDDAWGWGGDGHHATPRDAYRALWDSINGENEPWASNPLVVVLTFPPIGSVEHAKAWRKRQREA